MKSQRHIFAEGPDDLAFLASLVAQQDLSWYFSEESVVLNRLESAEEGLPKQIPFIFELNDIRPFRKDQPQALGFDFLDSEQPLFWNIATPFVETYEAYYSARDRRLWENVKVLRQRLALVTVVIRRMLANAIFPAFLCFIERHDKTWCILHGAHPPKFSAPGERAEFWRVSRLAHA